MKRSLGAKTIIYPTPVFLVGSYDARANPNIMTAAWGGICSSEPPSVAVSIREQRKTYANITASQAFTIGIPSAAHAKEADYVGIYSGSDEDKFEATGLTPVRSGLVNAPYVEECPLVLECKLAHTFNLGAHTQFVGEIIDAKVDESVLDDNGRIVVAKLQPFTFSPDDGGYYALGEFIGQAFSIGRKD